MKLSWRNFSLDLSRRTAVMGILNVTPDSFSDGGQFLDRRRAIQQALQMENDGADIIDVGGESTRPGAPQITAREEIGRVLPVVEALAGRLRVPLSIDTCKSAVADAALSAGASLVNDISGLRFDRRMVKTVARHGVPVVIMHIRGTPRDMQNNPSYEALIPEITDYFREGIQIARGEGISDEMMILDPGIGFGKTLEHNLEILRSLDAFTAFEKPILIGPSRKSFIGKILGEAPVTERMEGTAAAVAAGIMKGANMIRVHDVKPMVRVARTADSIKRGVPVSDLFRPVQT